MVEGGHKGHGQNQTSVTSEGASLKEEDCSFVRALGTVRGSSILPGVVVVAFGEEGV